MRVYSELSSEQKWVPYTIIPAIARTLSDWIYNLSLEFARWLAVWIKFWSLMKTNVNFCVVKEWAWRD